MNYTIFNTTDLQILELVEGDILNVEVKSEDGKLSMNIQKENESPIYEETGIETSNFQIDIKDSGNYKVSVTGEKAKGSFSIIKIIMNN